MNGKMASLDMAVASEEIEKPVTKTCQPNLTLNFLPELLTLFSTQILTSSGVLYFCRHTYFF